MTMDKSPNFDATKEFLNERLKDTATIGKSINGLKQGVDAGFSVIKGILSSVYYSYFLI